MERYHETQRGECFASISKLYGFRKIETLYEHPQNAALRRSRPNPFVLYPGDRVFIPEKELKEHEGATEQKHIFQMKTPVFYLRVLVQDMDGESSRLKPYELRLGTEIRSGRTDSTGFLKERVPADAETAELTVWYDAERTRFYRWKLQVRHLDPVEEITGVQARLNNLGFYCGAVDGVVTEQTTESIRAFQREQHLPETGEIDQALRAKLMELHRC